MLTLVSVNDTVHYYRNSRKVQQHFFQSHLA